jgi:hypothetical protein
MLHNPNWQKPKVNTLESLIAWLETKPPEQRYTYTNGWTCMVAQYYKAKGYWFVTVGPTRFGHGLNRNEELPFGFNAVAARGEPTFGAALERARGYVAA